jgi:hypothetical protein
MTGAILDLRHCHIEKTQLPLQQRPLDGSMTPLLHGSSAQSYSDLKNRDLNIRKLTSYKLQLTRNKIMYKSH